MAEVTRSGLSARVVKAIGIFSGVQMVSIVCSVVRTKLVALWIGAVGVGLFGLYNSALEMINSISQLGIRNSAVRDISQARSGNAVARIAAVVRRWSWALGMLGAILTLVLSPLLSQLTFGDTSHTPGFILLSVAVMANAIGGGELAILQGMARLKRLAKASVYGIVAGLAVSIPMFRFWGIDSIVPSIVAYTLATAIAALVLRERTPRPEPALTRRQVIGEGMGFVKLGAWMTASSFVTLLVSYVFMAWLNREADTTSVGYYQAGFTIVNRYVGLVFVAISMEYFPRLSRVKDSVHRTSMFVGHEMSIAMVVIMPVAALMAGIDDVVLRLLYKGDFEVAAPFVTWAIAGTAFRAASWCMAFTILARGDGRTYLLTESASAAVSLVLNIIAWRLWGLMGLGIAYIAWYLLYTVIVGIVYFRRYRLRLRRRVVWLSAVTVGVSVTCAVLRSADMRAAVLMIAAASAAFSLAALRRLMTHKK